METAKITNKGQITVPTQVRVRQAVELDQPLWHQCPASLAAFSIQSPIFLYPLHLFQT